MARPTWSRTVDGDPWTRAADQFAAAMGRWLGPDQAAAVVRPSGEGSPVDVLFGSDAATLGALRDDVGLFG